MDDNAEIKVADEYKTALNIKTPSLEQKVYNLSGGNQQKVSVAKWLFVKPRRPDPGRADARHRRGRQVRDLHRS